MQQTRSPPDAEAQGQSQETSRQSCFIRQARVWFILLLSLQVVLMVIRYHMGDAHGALLMFSVCAVGVLSMSSNAQSPTDVVYVGYFGLMVLVSGLLDVNLAIEIVAFHTWHVWRNHIMEKDWSGFVKPGVYLLCGVVQLLAAVVAYFVYKDAEGLDDESEDPLLTPDQARIYNAIVIHERQPANARSQGIQPFAGMSYKLT